MGTPGPQANGTTATVPCGIDCLGPSLAAITATGTFRQDAAHPTDPMYVVITATLTSTVSGRRAHLAVAHITGYLRVKPALSAELSFLPPPTLSFLPAQSVSAGVLPVPVVIFGWRGM